MNKKAIIVICVLLVIIIGLAIYCIINQYHEKDYTTEIYNSNFDAESELVHIQIIDSGVYSGNEVDAGLIIYGSGLVKRYNNILETEDNVKVISQEDINSLVKLVNEIDESKVTTMMTEIAVESGMVIHVYNSEGRKIMLCDFYSYNYSDATEQINNILKNNNII